MEIIMVEEITIIIINNINQNININNIKINNINCNINILNMLIMLRHPQRRRYR